MEHALLILFGIREIVRQIKELTTPGYVEKAAPGVVASNFLNILFGYGACAVGLGGYWSPLIPVGWTFIGAALLIGTKVPCGFQIVNEKLWMWVVRQILFVALGGLCYAHAFNWHGL